MKNTINMRYMNKLVFQILICFALVSNLATAQVGIGTTTPNPSSILDIASQTKGVLIPRTDTLSVINPAPGLIICDTATSTGINYFYFNGTYWQSLGENAGTFLDSFNGNRAIKRPNWPGVTGVNVGTTTNVGAFLNAVFFPFISATISINANVLVEIGTNNNVTISGATTPNDETVFSNGRVNQVFPSTTTIYSFGSATTYSTTFTFNPIGSVPASQEYRFVAYQSVANNGVAPFVINSSTKFVQSVYPYLHVVSSVNLTAGGTDAYSGVNKLIQARSNKTITHNSTTAGYIYFMYPASYGTLTSILDQNNFEQITAFTRFTSNVTSLGLANNWTTSYYIYQSNFQTIPSNWNYIYRY
jgi:hypothetical protein